MGVSYERLSRKSCWSSYKVLYGGFAAVSVITLDLHSFVNYSPIRSILKLLYSSDQLEKDALVG